MQCEVRAMGETNARARSTRTSDTLPKPGRVTEVCKEWTVHEDGALAYKLQKEEVEQHYTGNKSRNAIVREDFPRARDEQKKEEEEAIANYHQMVKEQEEKDAAIARQLALRIQRDEEEKRKRLEFHDIKVAQQMQEREIRKHSPVPPAMLSPVHAVPARIQPVGDINSVGLPDVSDLAAAQFRNLSVREREEWPPPPHLSPQLVDERGGIDDASEEEHRRRQELEDEVTLVSVIRNLSVREREEWPPPPHLSPQLEDERGGIDDASEEEHRRRQELEDEEFARLLQLQEERLGVEGLDQLDKDRLMAIEAQDKELAKLLQDRERAKARRARERAKQKALLKKQQDADMALGDRGESLCIPPPLAPAGVDVSPRHRQRYPDPEAIEVLTPGGSPLPNIAMAIDPTYSPHFTHSGASLDFEEFDEGPVPPYMPIQGQRRTSSLEKKKKKQSKEGCKQQ